MQGQAEGPLEDALRSAQTPTSLAGRAGGATCHWLELFPATPAPPNPCLACHQSFLLCVLDPVQDSRGSCGLGRTVCTSRVGQQLPLWTRATPSWTLTHPHFPGPTETRLALQPNSRKADWCEYVQGPGILARLPHSIRNIIGRGCATALPRSWACCGSSPHRCPGSLRTEPEPWDIATFGWQ